MTKTLPRIFDGAMGTWYAARYQESSQAAEAANRLYPERIQAIHRAYIDAGAQAILTNTFSLPQTGADPDLAEAAVHNAREAARGTDVQIFAGLGPVPEGEAKHCFGLIRRFLDLGVHRFLFETLPDLESVRPVIAFIREQDPDATVIVSFTAEADGLTRGGLEVTRLVQEADADGMIDAIGLNCILGPAAMCGLVQRIHCHKPLLVRPNAGTPAVVANRTAFSATPAYFGKMMARLAESGVEALGGCCGTNPAYIEALSKALEMVSPRPRPASPPADPEPEPAEPEIMELFGDGRKPVFVEADPPKDDDVLLYLGAVRQLKVAGADVITISDNPVGRPRADSCMLAGLIWRTENIPVLPHIACRDKNRNAIRSQLVGLSIEGVHQCLVITGDPVCEEDRSEVRQVYNFNSRKLAAYIRTLNETLLKTPMCVAGALNINALNFDVQLQLAKEKVDNGVRFLLTQPVLSARGLENLKRAHEELDCPILAGVFPVVSSRNAAYLANEVSGMDLDERIAPLYEGKSRGEAEDVARMLSEKVMRAAAPYCDGWYIMMPFRRTKLVRDLIRVARRLEKEENRR